MSFTGNEGDYITLTQASAYTAAYRAANPGATKGHFLGATKLKALLNQSGCVGLRSYYAINTSTGEKQLVVVGVDSNENDIVGGSALILDKSLLCPPNCGVANGLNS